MNPSSNSAGGRAATDAPEIVIDWLGGNCPVQAEGTIDGRAFYFRARGSHWSMEIAPHGYAGDYLDWSGAADIWEYDEPYGEWPDAGWMPEDEARAFIAKAAEKFAQQGAA